MDGIVLECPDPLDVNPDAIAVCELIDAGGRPEGAHGASLEPHIAGEISDDRPEVEDELVAATALAWLAVDPGSMVASSGTSSVSTDPVPGGADPSDALPRTQLSSRRWSARLERSFRQVYLATMSMASSRSTVDACRPLTAAHSASCSTSSIAEGTRTVVFWAARAGGGLRK